MKKIVVLHILLLSWLSAGAFDLGKHGQSFEIKEEGIIELIKRRLQDVDIEDENKKIQEQVKKKLYNPAPIAGINRAQENRVYYHDPTYILEEDAELPDGSILYPAGTQVNPLDYMDLERRMIFIDGSDKEQTEWLETILKDKDKLLEKGKTTEEDRVILVGGKPFELEKALDREVYFDQAATLTSQFGITQVPALVTQENRNLKIEEVVLDDSK